MITVDILELASDGGGQFTVMLEVEVPGLQASFAVYTFSYNFPPYNGHCAISPLEGTSLHIQK